MKLEGAAPVAYQTIMLVGIQDPKVLRALPRFLAQMHQVLVGRVRDTLASAGSGSDTPFDISLRPYGWNAVSGSGWNAVSGLDAPDAAPPSEIGLLFVATAPTQELATQIAKTCNPIFFHMPLERESELPSYAFAFSPAEIERGAVYEFRLNHVVQVDDPLALVRTEYVNTQEARHALAR
jgi:hypothetical protein